MNKMLINLDNSPDGSKSYQSDVLESCSESIMNKFKTEDQVRDEAKIMLGFDEKIVGVQCGTGQITTFNELGFTGVKDKPDGWYLPDSSSDVAIILEAKSGNKRIDDERWIAELFKNIDIVSNKYKRVVGILYNGTDVLVYTVPIRLTQTPTIY